MATEQELNWTELIGKPEGELWSIARRRALTVLRLWPAPRAVEEYLRSGEESRRCGAAAAVRATPMLGGERGAPRDLAIAAAAAACWPRDDTRRAAAAAWDANRFAAKAEAWRQRRWL